MLKDLRVVRRSARIAANAALTARDAYANGRVKQETSITDRMLNAIELGLDGRVIKGLRWEAATLTNNMKNSEESRYGADFLGVLSINLNSYQITKGFLAQAKRIGPDSYFPPKEKTRLLTQCNLMLSHTIASFVFLYSRDDISIVPATAVVASNGVNPWQLYPRSISSFFERHIECFIGDPRIASTNILDLRMLSEEVGVRRAILMSLSSPRERQDEPEGWVNE